MNAVISPVDTKTRILDAAELIFSQDGFDAASLRTITAAAQVNLAAVNYHFHSKEALFCAVIARRAAPVNKRRLELLELITGKPTLERILEAFLRPVMDKASTGIACFRPLMARLHSVPLELHTRILEENFVPTLNRFVDVLSQALPLASKEQLKLGMFFVIGSMAQTMAWEPVIKSITVKGTGQLHGEDFLARLVTFGAAGFRAMPPKTVSKRVNN